VNILSEIARDSKSSVALERAYQELEILNNLGNEQGRQSIETQQRIGLARGTLQEVRSPEDAQVTYQLVAGLVSDDIVEKMVSLRSLPKAEQQDIRQLRNLHIIALNNYAMSTSRTGVNLDQGLAYINRGLEILPDQAQMLDTRAEIYIAMGDHSSAVKDALQASTTLPENLSLKLTLAKAYILAGNYELARVALEDISNQNELSPSPSQKIRAEIANLERKIISGKAA
jgi:predicted Zn-dependent protease